MNPVVLPWLTEIVLISWRSLTGTHFTLGGSAQPGQISGKVIQVSKGTKRLPLPSELLATFIAFGAYSMIAEKDARIAQLLGWGTVLATGLLLLSSGGQSAATPPGLRSPGYQFPGNTPNNYPTRPPYGGAQMPYGGFNQ